MFSKVLIFALAAAVANCQVISSYATGGLPVYRTSGLYGGLYGANGYGYGANFGRVAGLGALRTSGAIIGRGALGYGTGALVAGVPAYRTGVVGAGVLGAGVVGAGLGVAGLGINRGISVAQAGPVNAAVQTLSRTVDYRPVPYTGEPAAVQDIDVPPQESPLRINFQSKSSPLLVSQQHIPAEPGQVQVTQSEDEPQQVVHNVLRSVNQQVNEVIQPYRTLTQTVEPVIEQTNTNIAQGEGVRLTGLQSGVIGGTGQIAASGVGVVAPAVAGVGVAGYRSGLGLGYGLGYGGLYGSRLGYGNVYGSGVYGTGLGLGNIYGSGLYGGYGSGLYGGYGRSLGLYGSGIGLSGLSGLSSYGSTYGSRIGRLY